MYQYFVNNNLISFPQSSYTCSWQIKNLNNLIQECPLYRTTKEIYCKSAKIYEDNNGWRSAWYSLYPVSLGVASTQCYIFVVSMVLLHCIQPMNRLYFFLFKNSYSSHWLQKLGLKMKYMDETCLFNTLEKRHELVDQEETINSNHVHVVEKICMLSQCLRFSSDL